MQKLLSHVLAILSRVLNRRERPRAEGIPATYRSRQVARTAQPKVYLKLLSPGERRKFGPVIGASIGTVVVAGFTGPALAQSEESCAFVWELRSPYTVERVLRNFPTDPCIPILLEALP